MGMRSEAQCSHRFLVAGFQVEKYEMVAVHASTRNEMESVQPHEVET